MPADPTQRSAPTSPGRARARILLGILMLFVIGTGVGGYFGWKAYDRRQQEDLAARVAAEGGINPRGFGRGMNAPRVPQNFRPEMERREQRNQAAQLEQALAGFKSTPTDQQDAFVDRLIGGGRGRWQNVAREAATQPAGDPARDAFLATLNRRLTATATPQRQPNRAATTRPERQNNGGPNNAAGPNNRQNNGGPNGGFNGGPARPARPTTAPAAT